MKMVSGVQNKMADETVDEIERKEGGFTRVSAKNNTRKDFLELSHSWGRNRIRLQVFF